MNLLKPKLLDLFCGAGECQEYLTDYQKRLDSQAAVEALTPFCKTCFDKFCAEKPRSPDQRYCRGCYETWLALSPELSPAERTRWVPKTADILVNPQQPLLGLELDASECVEPVKEIKRAYYRRGRPPRVFNTEEMGVLTNPNISVRKAGQLLNMNFMSVQHHRTKIKARGKS